MSQNLYIQFYTFPNMATNNILSKEPQAPHIFTKLYYVHTYAPLYKFKVFPYKIINYNTDTKVRRILLCSSVWRTCTWKIVFKTKNNELNELSECMLLEIVSLFRKTSKICKTSFYMIFSRNISFFSLLYFKSF